MTHEELVALLGYGARTETLHQEEVERRYTSYCDLRALNLLAQIVPIRRMKWPPLHSVPRLMMIAAAEHDRVWFTTDTEELAAVITLEQVLELSDCGVFYDAETSSLSLYI